MLILTRKAGEQLRIGDQIVVTVQRVDRNSVRIGIEAPGEVPIVRGELLAEISDAALSAEVG
ncbi:MAG TPA: carbon storage regulator [Pirellulales bacterium]|nr:carbon storage regulator [Pirellulales bacterium]